MTESHFITAKQLIEMGVTELPMLVEPFFPKVGVAILAGSSDCGKSTLLR